MGSCPNQSGSDRSWRSQEGRSVVTNTLCTKTVSLSVVVVVVVCGSRPRARRRPGFRPCLCTRQVQVHLPARDRACHTSAADEVTPESQVIEFRGRVERRRHGSFLRHTPKLYICAAEAERISSQRFGWLTVERHHAAMPPTSQSIPIFVHAFCSGLR